MAANTRVVKLGEDGTITFSMPELTDQYLLVEEEDGRIILSPYDLRWETNGDSIARVGSKLHFIRSSQGAIAEA